MTGCHNQFLCINAKTSYISFPLCSLCNHPGKLPWACCLPASFLLLQVIDSIKAGVLEEFIMLIIVVQVVWFEVWRSCGEIVKKQRTNLSHFFAMKCLEDYCLFRTETVTHLKLHRILGSQDLQSNTSAPR